MNCTTFVIKTFQKVTTSRPMYSYSLFLYILYIICTEYIINQREYEYIGDIRSYYDILLCHNTSICHIGDIHVLCLAQCVVYVLYLFSFPKFNVIVINCHVINHNYVVRLFAELNSGNCCLVYTILSVC